MVSGIIAFGAGAFAWTFAEYALHGWAFHMTKRRLPMKQEHIKHHATPSYFAPTRLKVLYAIAVLGVLFAALQVFVGVAVALGGALGFASSYFAYEVLHRRLHTHPPTGAYSRWARRHHFHHHFGNPRVNHGVTTPLWDIVFGTFARPESVRVPHKLAPVWLWKDDERNEFDAAFEPEYVLVRPRARA